MTVFAALWLDAELTSQAAFMWYNLAVGCFGTIAWILMLTQFKFKAKGATVTTAADEESRLVNKSEEVLEAT